MNLLVISTDNKLEVTAPLWRHAKNFFEFDHQCVAREEGLFDFIAGADFSRYDRVVVDGNLRRMGRSSLALKSIPNLVVFDHDVCQNNVPSSNWYHRYPSILRALGKVRVIVSGVELSQQLKEEGIDACFLPKAYDDAVISDLGLERKIEAAFVGRTKHKAYRQRKQFLMQAEKKLGVPTLRAERGAPYNALLNNIGIFVSVDIGYNEYMIKNYEAMAAGCAVLAWRQPQQENDALGFRDMENIVFYRSFEEFEDRLSFLKANPQIAKRIAQAGKELVEKRHTWRNRAQEILPLIEPDIQQSKPMNLLDQWRVLLARR